MQKVFGDEFALAVGGLGGGDDRGDRGVLAGFLANSAMSFA